MTITDLTKNLEAATLTIVTEYRADADRVWRLWADPRQLERWWGPPGFPATVTDHEFELGGLVRYYMTGPDGEKYHGGWTIREVAPPHRLEFQDFFADDAGNENPDLPVSTTVVTIADAGGGRARMTLTTEYASTEAMKQVLEMGMEEGIRLALGQVDELLEE